MNTALRFLCTPLLVTLVAIPLAAQSVLYFPRVLEGPDSGTNFTITNPSTSDLEVEFTLFTLDGEIGPLAANPVRYRIQTQGVFSMGADDVFAASTLSGWVEVRADGTDWTGVLFSGDLRSTLDGVAGANAYSDQVVVIPQAAPTVARALRVVNPSDTVQSVHVAVFNEGGNLVATFPEVLEARTGTDIGLTTVAAGGPGALTVRLTSSQPVVAQGVVSTSGSLTLINGQATVALSATFRVAPHVVLGNGFDSELVLSNPTGQAVTVFATLRSETGGPIHASQSAAPRQPLTIPANGNVSVGVRALAGIPFISLVNGWIEIESPNVPIAGVLVLSQGTNQTTYPLQSAPQTGIVYARPSSTESQLTGLALTNLSEVPAEIEVVVLDARGDALARSSILVGANTKQTTLVRDLLPGLDLTREGTLVLRSSSPVYGIEIIAGVESGFLGAIEGTTLPVGFRLDAVAASRPTITSVVPEEVRSGDTLQIRGTGFDSGSTLLFDGRVMDVDFFFSAFGVLSAEVPDREPGYVDLRIRSASGTESEPHTILVLPPEPISVGEVRGRAFYEKIDVTADGLNLSRSVKVPIREARVDVFNQLTGDVFSVADTDAYGSFRAIVPTDPGYGIRVLSQSALSGLVVADNTNDGAVYSVRPDVATEQFLLLVATDSTRISGAFNVLEVLRQGNEFLRETESSLVLPELTIFWSPANTTVNGNLATGQIAGTFFNAANNTAFILGDRDVDSDEFDDGVILHEYAHLLSERFSRDDSPGGEHVLGDILDPRVAWSEGWANFFSGLVRANPIYRDSFGLAGTAIQEHDLEENVPSGDQPGYWSEFSVHSVLWDLVDVREDDGDTTQLPFNTVWQAFRGLSDDTFVYLPSFLDRLTTLEPTVASEVEQIARSRSIDYLALAEPSVSNPFPRMIVGIDAVTGEVDSLSRERANLAQSAHLYSFDVEGGAVSVRLDVTGLGPARNPGANDLDLLLMDSAGRVLALSDRGLNGQSELISAFLPAGRYVIEIRSFYTSGETGEFVFNSGAYRLRIRLH